MLLSFIFTFMAGVFSGFALDYFLEGNYKSGRNYIILSLIEIGGAVALYFSS